MYTKILFLMICGTYLHAASYQHSHSFPPDSCNQHAHIKPSSSSRLEPGTSVIFKTTRTKGAEPDQTVNPKIYAPSPEMILLERQLDAIRTQEQHLTQEMHSDISALKSAPQEASTGPTMDSYRLLKENTEQKIESMRACRDKLRLERDSLRKKYAFEKAKTQIELTALNTPNDHVKNVLQALLSAELWSLAQSVTMNELHLNIFTQGFMSCMPTDVQQDYADRMLSGMKDLNRLEARLTFGDTTDILAWTTIKLLQFARSINTFSTDDDTQTVDLNADVPPDLYFVLGQDCFDAFTKALQEKGITLSFDAEQEADPQEPSKTPQKS